MKHRPNLLQAGADRHAQAGKVKERIALQVHLIVGQEEPGAACPEAGFFFANKALWLG